MGLFYLDKANKVALCKEAYQVIPEFKKLSDDEMRFVILYTDYDSPFKQWPDKERKSKAQRWVFGEKAKDPEKDPKIRKAIEQFNELQFDDNRELYRTYQRKMTNFQLLYQNEEDPVKSDKYLIAIKNLRVEMNALHREIITNAQTEHVLKGNRKMSFLEKLRANKKLAEMRSTQAEKLGKINLMNELPTNNESKKENLIG